MHPPPFPDAPDVLVIGGGLIGLASALAAAERGFTVRVVTRDFAGAASAAAAGLLAPSIDRAEGPAHDFAVAARDRYPDYLAWLRERSGFDVPLNREGIIQLAIGEAGVRGLQRAMPPGSQWLEPRELAELEPALAHGLGAVLHPMDGCVDNVRLLEALRRALSSHPRVVVVADAVVQLRFVPHVSAVGASGTAYMSERTVLAAGAWSGTITGLPRSVPVEPVRGQMLSYSTAPVRRAVFGPTGYLVPRPAAGAPHGGSRERPVGGRATSGSGAWSSPSDGATGAPNGMTLAGSTVERTGYESVTTPEGIARLRRSAAEILPVLARIEPAEAWAGLRPVSADQQPILCADPDEPRLLYATGHSRNGVLMTPLTGDCVAAMLAGDPLPADIGAFAIDRFE